MTATIATALHPADSQRVFRAVLEAMARPATAMALPPGPLRMLAPAVVPVFALADLGTGVCVLENEIQHASATGEFQHWADAVATATSAPLWPAELARLVSALRPVTDEEVRGFCRGTAEAPEDGALVSLAVAELDGGDRRWRLSGPGIADTATLAPRGLPDSFVAARAEAVAAYPAGIDVLLVTDDGRVVGLPRTTTITEES
ncbi:MAG TPA: phosphonate C-P lyase system protein PhnH [Asanoa sp.]|nr:phosphonate C-P lyase system protein PhnH [Asanoa sp.]